MSTQQRQIIIQGQLEKMGLNAFTPLESTVVLSCYGKRTTDGVYQITLLQSTAVSEMYILQHQTPWSYSYSYYNLLHIAQSEYQELLSQIKSY